MMRSYLRMNSFWEGFEKRAKLRDVWLDRLKGLFTGKRTLYHGTSQYGKRHILRKGLIPDLGGGATKPYLPGGTYIDTHPELEKLQKGLVFLTEDPDAARMYANNVQEGRINKLFDNRNPRINKEHLLKKWNKLVDKGAVVKIKVPKKLFKKVTNPEHVLEAKDQVAKRPLLSRLFNTDYVIKGAIPPQYVKGVVKKAEIGLGFWAGFEKRAEDVVYHGSPSKMRVIRPKNLHGDPGVKNVIFASPHPQMAAAYVGAKWGDRDINQSSRVRKSTGKREFILEEMRPGAFDDLFKGKKGYLYTLPARKFTGAATLGRKNTSEVVGVGSVKPLAVTTIKDALDHLRGQGVVLKNYNPKSTSYRGAINRMKQRAHNMGDGKRSYLRWVGETNPLLAKKLQ
jgi:hypothetical protein